MEQQKSTGLASSNSATSKVQFFNKLIDVVDNVCIMFGHEEGFDYYKGITRFRNAVSIKKAVIYLLHDYGFKNALIAELTGFTNDYVHTVLKRRAEGGGVLTETIYRYTLANMSDKETLAYSSTELLNSIIEEQMQIRKMFEESQKNIKRLEAKLGVLFHN